MGNGFRSMMGFSPLSVTSNMSDELKGGATSPLKTSTPLFKHFPNSSKFRSSSQLSQLSASPHTPVTPPVPRLVVSVPYLRTTAGTPGLPWPSLYPPSTRKMPRGRRESLCSMPFCRCRDPRGRGTCLSFRWGGVTTW